MSIEKAAQKLGTTVGTAIGNGQKAAEKVKTTVVPAVKKGGEETLNAMDIFAQSVKAAIEKAKKN